jgi:hypothetical protein
MPESYNIVFDFVIKNYHFKSLLSNNIVCYKLLCSTCVNYCFEKACNKTCKMLSCCHFCIFCTMS